MSAHPDALLAQVRVTRDHGRLDVTALWVLPGRNRRELVMRDANGWTRVRQPDEKDLRLAFPAISPTAREASPPLRRLLSLQVPSLRPGLRAVIGGGDGATLLPFEKVARSAEYDDWSVQPLPRFDGALAYVGGGVVLPDGRLLVLLDHFSDDRTGKPAARDHGLWVSRGDDWSAYRPMAPTFEPPITERRDGWSEVDSLGATTDHDPVLWVTTWDQRLYVSTDPARTFGEVEVR